MPDWNNAYDWFYNIYTGHTDKLNFYLINAESIEEAKLKYFNHLYDNNYINISYTAWESTRYLLQEMSEEAINAKYTPEDTQIILKISRNFLDLTEIEQSKYSPHDHEDLSLVDKLSENTKRTMSYKTCEIMLGILPLVQRI